MRPSNTGIFARGFAHVVDILGHAVVLHDVVLGQHLAAELRGEVNCAHHEEEREAAAAGGSRRMIVFEDSMTFQVVIRWPETVNCRLRADARAHAVRIPAGRTLLVNVLASQRYEKHLLDERRCEKSLSLPKICGDFGVRRISRIGLRSGPCCVRCRNRIGFMITLDTIRKPVTAELEAFDDSSTVSLRPRLLSDMLRYALSSRGKASGRWCCCRPR